MLNHSRTLDEGKSLVKSNILFKITFHSDVPRVEFSFKQKISIKNVINFLPNFLFPRFCQAWKNVGRIARIFNFFIPSCYFYTRNIFDDISEICIYINSFIDNVCRSKENTVTRICFKIF